MFKLELIRKIFLLIAAVVSVPPAHASIFGADDRVDVISPSAAAGLGQATAIGVNTGLITVRPDGRLDLYSDPMDELLCSDQRFIKQRYLSFNCSAFLIAPDVLVTAGHCQANPGEMHKNEPEGYCKVFDWLFDFQVDETGVAPTKNISADRLYHCKRTIFAINESVAPFRDFAIIQLDRPVAGRKPLKIAQAPVVLGDAVSMIGYPMGLPMKYAGNARVKFNDPSAMAFVANLDSFDGNSGSAVFNARDELVGILVGGTPSLSRFERPGEKCNVLNRCDDNGENCLMPDTDPKAKLPGFQAVGSDVQRIGPVIEVLKSMGVAGF